MSLLFRILDENFCPLGQADICLLLLTFWRVGSSHFQKRLAQLLLHFAKQDMQYKIRNTKYLIGLYYKYICIWDIILYNYFVMSIIKPTNYAWKFGWGILNISCKKLWWYGQKKPQQQQLEILAELHRPELEHYLNKMM